MNEEFCVGEMDDVALDECGNAELLKAEYGELRRHELKWKGDGIYQRLRKGNHQEEEEERKSQDLENVSAEQKEDEADQREDEPRAHRHELGTEPPDGERGQPDQQGDHAEPGALDRRILQGPTTFVGEEERQRGDDEAVLVVLDEAPVAHHVAKNREVDAEKHNDQPARDVDGGASVGFPGRRRGTRQIARCVCHLRASRILSREVSL